MKKGVSMSFVVVLGLSFTLFGSSVKSYGAEIKSVSQLQQRLQEIGYNVGSVDGIYGKRTAEAVRAFQADSGLRADGITGPATISALEDTDLQYPVSRASAVSTTVNTASGSAGSLNAGLSEDSVMELQSLLRLAGYNVGASDGIFGARTDAAVRAFQSNMGLRPDGIVGRATMAALGMGTTNGMGTNYGTETDNGYTQQRTSGTYTAAETVQQENSSTYNTADIQRLLLDAGYSAGSIDGVLGTRTESAIRAFQAGHGLNPDGVVGPATLQALLRY